MDPLKTQYSSWLPSGRRPETGVMRFEEDWPGVFIRGDHALMGYLPAVEAAVIELQVRSDRQQLTHEENGRLLALRSLRELLASCAEGGDLLIVGSNIVRGLSGAPVGERLTVPRRGTVPDRVLRLPPEIWTADEVGQSEGAEWNALTNDAITVTQEMPVVSIEQNTENHETLEKGGGEEVATLTVTMPGIYMPGVETQDLQPEGEVIAKDDNPECANDSNSTNNAGAATTPELLVGFAGERAAGLPEAEISEESKGFGVLVVATQGLQFEGNVIVRSGDPENSNGRNFMEGAERAATQDLNSGPVVERAAENCESEKNEEAGVAVKVMHYEPQKETENENAHAQKSHWWQDELGGPLIQN